MRPALKGPTALSQAYELDAEGRGRKPAYVLSTRASGTGKNTGPFPFLFVLTCSKMPKRLKDVGARFFWRDPFKSVM
jgi:hypothetical protein